MSFGFISKQNIKNSIKGAENTPATSSYLGTVRADGVTILIDALGTISVDPTAVSSLSSVTATNIANVSSVSYTNFTTLSSSLNTLSSNTWKAGTTSVLGLVKADGSSILVTSGVISAKPPSNWDWAQSSNGSLIFYYNGTAKMSLDSSGTATFTGDVIAFGTI